MLTCRRAELADLTRVAAFYRAVAYGGVLHANDEILLIEDDVDLVGAVRLAQENGVIVLRGMRVLPSHQGTGLGTRLLGAVGAALGDRSCYCIPYAHLVGFYAQIGFAEVDVGKAPAFLGARLQDYRRSREQAFTIMLRPGRV
jgi:N-acetylglutamate synthase-like GNAT family acetyltransferase